MPDKKNKGQQPSPEDEDLLSMIQQHLAEAEQNIRAEQRRARQGDQITQDNIWSDSAREGQARSYARQAAPPPQQNPYSPRVSPVRQSPPPPLPEPVKKKPRKKKRRPVRRFFSMLLVIALLLGVFATAFAYYEAGKVRYDEAAETYDRPRGLKSSLLVTNILLIGLDGDEGASSLRSDTMMLVSIDHSSGALKLTSFLRDSWVTLASGGEAKLNTAYARGGAELVKATLELNFGVRIDHHVIVDYTGFENIVDALDGVAVAITEAEITFLCNTTRLGKQIGRTSMREQMESGGVVQLTGEQALIYCRIRKLDSDFNRTARQQKVLSAIVQKLKQNPLKLLSLPDEILPCLRTSMSRARLTALALCAPVYMAFDIEQHSVPADGTYKHATKSGSSVLSLDIEANTEQLKEFIYG